MSKVLSVLDKGVRDRVTKNGECLRRHADMRHRWRGLREDLTAVGAAMARAQVLLTEAEALVSDEESLVSFTSNADIPEKRRTLSSASALGRSISPFRKMAARMTRTTTTEAATPTRPSGIRKVSAAPSSEPVLRHRVSLAHLRSSQTSQASTELTHRHTSSTQLSSEVSSSVFIC